MVDYNAFPNAGTLAGQSLGTAPHSQLHGDLGAAAQDLNTRLVAMEPGSRVSTIRTFGHSWGTRGPLTWASNCCGLDIFAQQMHVPSTSYFNWNVFGQRVLTGTPSCLGTVLGSTTAGQLWYNRPYSPADGTYGTYYSYPSPWMNSYNDPNYAAAFPPHGLSVLLTGSSDVNNFGDTDQRATDVIAALKWAFRSMLARLQATRVHESTDASAGITLGGSGSWSTTNSTAQNSGSGYSVNSSQNSTVTIHTGANFAGGTVDIGFVTNWVGGSIPGSLLAITLDGATQTGYAGYPLNTSALTPSNIGQAGHATVTFKNLSSGDHTIVVTAGSGGMAFDYWGIRATNPYAPPVIVCDTTLLPSGGYGVSNGDTKFGNFNTMVEAVVTEFDNVKVAHLSSFVGNADVNFYPGDHLHFSDIGQSKVALALWDAFSRLTLTSAQVPFL